MQADKAEIFYLKVLIVMKDFCTMKTFRTISKRKRKNTNGKVLLEIVNMEKGKVGDMCLCMCVISESFMNH